MDGEALGSSTAIPSRSSPPRNTGESPEIAITVSSAATAEEEGPVGSGGRDSKVGDAVVLEVGMVPVEEEEQQQVQRGAAAADGCGAVSVSGPEEKAVSVVLDVNCGGGKGLGGGGGGDWDSEKECRICQVTPDRREGSDLIQLGCGCKGELGIAHRHCAETWFKLKGNRCCEICGVGAKNITGIEDMNFMDEWNENGILGSGSNGNSYGRCGCCRGQPFCNFLMAFLVIAFILPWFFRVNVF